MCIQRWVRVLHAQTVRLRLQRGMMNVHLQPGARIIVADVPCQGRDHALRQPIPAAEGGRGILHRSKWLQHTVEHIPEVHVAAEKSAPYPGAVAQPQLDLVCQARADVHCGDQHQGALCPTAGACSRRLVYAGLSHCPPCLHIHHGACKSYDPCLVTKKGPLLSCLACFHEMGCAKVLFGAEGQPTTAEICHDRKASMHAYAPSSARCTGGGCRLTLSTCCCLW
jgi:hypothetical protein